MSDAYMPTPRCPVCDEEIDGSAEEVCPSCQTVLYNCGRCGTTVSESEYRTGVSMCENCWHDTVNQ